MCVLYVCCMCVLYVVGMCVWWWWWPVCEMSERYVYANVCVCVYVCVVCVLYVM